jgi:hypothetical protein
MNCSSSAKDNLLGIALGVIFLLAIVMGAGPGIYLINPDSADPDAKCTFLSMPIVYAWIVFWFLVQAGVILVAYFKLWKEPQSERSGETPEHDND